MACKSPTPQQSDVAWRGIITLLDDQENAESQWLYSKWQFLRSTFQSAQFYMSNGTSAILP